MSADRGWCAVASRGIAPLSVSTFCPARGDAGCHGRRLQRPQRARLLTVAIVLGGDVLVLKAGPPQPITTAWTDVWLLGDGRRRVHTSHESEPDPGQAP